MVDKLLKRYHAGDRGRKMVLLDGVDVTRRCFRADVYEHGSGRVWLILLSGGSPVPSRLDDRPSDERASWGNTAIEVLVGLVSVEEVGQ